MQARWHGHSFFVITTRDGRRIAVDPNLAAARARAADIDVDIVLVTHAHNDHSGDALAFGRPVLSTFEIANELERRGGTTIGMGVGGFYRWDGLRIWCAPAVHSSDFESPDGQPAIPGGTPCGFVIDDGETRLYHAGDTAIHGDMRAVVRDLLRPHVAALPIGDRYTMGVEHAARATEWLGVAVAIPMHYDTFPEIQADPKEFERLVGTAARVVIPPIGGGVEMRGSEIVRLLPPG